MKLLRNEVINGNAHRATAEDVPAVQLLLRYLEEQGVEYLFGVPGGPLMPLYEALADRQHIRPIIAKHEEGAAFMADGYARVSHRLGVCCATTGPGATNALTGIACAYLDSIPVLLITAQIALDAFGKGAAQESSPQSVDVVRLFQQVTKTSLMLHTAATMGETCRTLLRTALTGRTGPVHLNIPANLQKRSVEATSWLRRSFCAQAKCVDRTAIRSACHALAKARRPAILAGSGVVQAQAWTELRVLAERLGCPVATTPKAKGVFPEDHPQSVGVFGFAGSPQADACFLSNDVDVMVAVGTSLGELATHAWSPNLQPTDCLIQIDLDPSEIGKNYPVNIAIVGDAQAVLDEMTFGMKREMAIRGHSNVEARMNWLHEIKASHRRTVRPEGFDDQSVPLQPQRLVGDLQRALPKGAHLFVDIGNSMAWALHFLTVTEPGTFHINLGLGSMGHAVAAVIGAKLAAPNRPAIALVGDAAFAMHGAEVHTAVESGLPVLWIVMNNGGHGMVCHGEQIQFKGKVSTGPFQRPLDIVGWARAMGAKAIRVAKPGQLVGAIQEALSAQWPTVIEAIVDPKAMPPLTLRIATLDRFFEGETPELPKVAA